jgi:hypothetical protein
MLQLKFSIAVGYLLFFLVVFFIPMNMNLCLSNGMDSRLGDAGKCGRDCIYYVCHRLGQQVTLDAIDQELSGRENIAFADMRQAFENRGFFCQSFLFNKQNVRSLKTNFNVTDRPVYAIAALPNSTDSDNHFVIILRCEGTHLTVFDVSNNKTGIIDIAHFKGNAIELPVLLIGTKPIHYQVVSRSELIMMILVFCVFVLIVIFLYSFSPVPLIQKILIGGKTRLVKYLTYRKFVIGGISVFVFVILIFLSRECFFIKYPLRFKMQHIQLGDIELFTKNDIYFEVMNRSFYDIPIEDIRVTCHCLKIESYPKMIEAKTSQKVKFVLAPLLEGDVSYQTLIVPEESPPIMGQISYKGFQQVSITPRYYNVGMISKGEQKTVTCKFSLKDLREESLIITSVQMQGDTPIFETERKLPSRLRNNEIFEITIKHLGNAPRGNFLQSFELRGKGSDSGKEIILTINFVGIIVSENE